MLKHSHREFPSDVFTLLESVGATLTIGSSLNLSETYDLLQFLKLDMSGKLILSINLPSFPTGSWVYRCYKLGKRYQNSAAYVNAGLLFHIDPNTFRVLDRPRICFGGIGARLVHAEATEAFLDGKNLSGQTLKEALSILQTELASKLDPRPAFGSEAYRLALAEAYLYRFFLAVKGPFINRRLQSGGEEIARGSNKGIQVFDTDKRVWPLNQPVPKLESYPQASGEAEFINDMRARHNEVFGVFVVSTVGNARIVSVDASKALVIRKTGKINSFGILRFNRTNVSIFR